MAVFLDKHERLPPHHHHRGWEVVVHGLYDALLHLGYNVDVPVYRAHMSMAHSTEQCEVSVTITLNPT
jgi:hypothetical protein